MGCCKSLSFIIAIIVSLFVSSSFAQSPQNNNSARISLDALLQHYAYRELSRSHSTGILYKVSLPANLSSMEASLVRFRSGSFWIRGAKFSSFGLPPRIMPLPYVKRLAIVYQNLRDLSSYYYKVPGYSFVTPVVGFRAYDASSNLSSSNVMAPVNLSVLGDPISVHFPRFLLTRRSNLTARCVTFNVDGTVSFANLTLPYVCSTRTQGHFSIVVKKPKRKVRNVGDIEGNVRKARRVWKVWKWCVIGLLCGFVGLVLGCVVAMLVKHKRAKKIQKMERKADQGESFKTIWIGPSKMPSAAVTRTQPILENGYAP